ncbi:MAG: hypothetical protein WCF40_01450 [Desulfobacterales bacterium]
MTYARHPTSWKKNHSSPDWVNRIFFACYDATSVWLDDLQPAFGEKQFLFKPGLRLLKSAHGQRFVQRQKEVTEEAALEYA